MQIHHPFLLRLEASFRDEDKLYMVTELIQGGELFSVLSRHNRVKPPVAQFYGACVVSALEHLHLGASSDIPSSAPSIAIDFAFADISAPPVLHQLAVTLQPCLRVTCQREFCTVT